MDLSSSESTSTEILASKSCPQFRQGVRVVGKIQPFVDSEAIEHSSVSITRFDGDHALIDFGDQNNSKKDCYKLDWCYDKNDGVMEVFNGEVKPLLDDLYQGRNLCVIAYGAKGTGKSRLIQGYGENPGLALVTVSEILSLANETRSSVAISCYEVVQDHIYDILDPKGQEVFVLEDATKKIQLKGLSQVPINSVSDFRQIYCQLSNQKKASQKLTDDTTIRCHRGLIVYVFSGDNESKSSMLGKLNVIDLAGYEDSKQKVNVKPQLLESAKVNKSLYALLNVVYALNSAENYVPYRESKLTRLLQDFMCKACRVVLITCLTPRICQDNIHVVKLASRSCQVANQISQDSTKIMKSTSRLLPSCSPSTQGMKNSDIATKKNKFPISASIEKRENKTPLMTKMRPKPLVSSVKKQDGSTSFLVEKRANDTLNTIKGRNLFNASTSTLIENLKDNALSNVHVSMDASDEGNLEFHSLSRVSSTHELGKVELHASDANHPESDEDGDIADNANLLVAYHDGIEESKEFSIDKDKSSPSISERLKEISNSLKLFSIQSTNVETPKLNELNIKEIHRETAEPKTPRVTFDTKLDRDSNIEYIGTPHDVLKNRSTGLKNSLVQDCLTFLNSANKDELKGLKGIGEKRANYILQLREKKPEPFKDIDDLKDLGLSSKQINAMMSRVLGDF